MEKKKRLKTMKGPIVLTLGFIVVGLIPLGCLEKSVNRQKDISLDSDESKFSYAVGYEIGRNMKRQNVKLDYKAFEIAVIDVMEGKKERLNNEQRRDIMRKMSEKKRKEDKDKAEKNKTAGKAFLEGNKKKDGVKVTQSGLQYEIIKPGDGKKPTKDDIVEVHYKGSLIDGTQFDSSYERNKPAEFPLKAVIPGWTEGLQLMNVGSKYKLYVPSELGYGERGNPTIPGNSVLIFEVELLSIKSKDDKSKDKKAVEK